MQRGDEHSQILRHAIQRAILLLLLGWGLYCIGPGRITFRFQNVLAQLSVTYLIAFLMMRRTFRAQLIVSFALIGLSELLYRFFPVDGFNQPFEPDHNFGAYVDLWISGELSGGQAQRVALAKAVVRSPAVLLLDEPLCHLDTDLRLALRAELKLLCSQRGLTTIYVTHNYEDARDLGNRVAVMDAGRLTRVSGDGDDNGS